MNKRYWLFAGYECYPNGGMRDFIGSYDTVEDAEYALSNYSHELDYMHDEFDWFEVLDSKKMKIVHAQGSPVYDWYKSEELNK